MTVVTEEDKQITEQELPVWVSQRYNLYSFFRQRGIELEEIKYILGDMPISIGKDD